MYLAFLYHIKICINTNNYVNIAASAEAVFLMLALYSKRMRNIKSFKKEINSYNDGTSEKVLSFLASSSFPVNTSVIIPAPSRNPYVKVEVSSIE